MSHPFTFRPGTQDASIFHHLTSHNEYRLPDQIGPEETILDVGVHIGSFCYSALDRGARRVFGFEAEPSNHACAARNLASYGDRVTLSRKAVWRSDRPVPRLTFDDRTDQANTGGGGVLYGAADGETVEAEAFDDIIDRITGHGRTRISLLKIDCEGSEFPILMTSRRIHLIDRIAGEFHEIGTPANPASIPSHAAVPGVDEFSLRSLSAYLAARGFHVEAECAPGARFGLFFATYVGLPSVATRLKGYWHQLSGHAPMGLDRARRRSAAGSDR